LGELGSEEVIIHPADASPRDLYKLLIGLIVPRPIAWVSTRGKDGVNNLAPFSFFNAFSADPPVLGFAPSRKVDGDNRKDTLRNVEDTGVFVVNMVSEAVAEAMNQSAADVPPDVDEFTLGNVTATPATLIDCPMVAEAPAKLECRVQQIIPMGDRPTSGILVLGEVICFHLDDAMVDNFRIDPDVLRAVGRMGGMSYTRTRDRFDLLRPGMMKG
jgi:flavin reductase (DIM6/NTAB) family NADH-FMN oxidoreductase RutF